MCIWTITRMSRGSCQLSLQRTGVDHEDASASHGWAPYSRIWNAIISLCLKQWIWPRTGLCGRCGQRMSNPEMTTTMWKCVQVHELALQYGRIRDSRFNAQFQTAINFRIDFNWKFELRLTSVSELQYNAQTDPKDKVSQCQVRWDLVLQSKFNLTTGLTVTVISCTEKDTCHSNSC